MLFYDFPRYTTIRNRSPWPHRFSGIGRAPTSDLLPIRVSKFFGCLARHPVCAADGGSPVELAENLWRDALFLGLGEMIRQEEIRKHLARKATGAALKLL
jgi:hypothetical protein